MVRSSIERHQHLFVRIDALQLEIRDEMEKATLPLTSTAGHAELNGECPWEIYEIAEKAVDQRANVHVETLVENLEALLHHSHKDPERR